MISRSFVLIGCLLSCMALSGQQSNPFDIIRNDTIREVTAPVQAEPEEESTKLEGENPFSVSHIPIRKNQYEQIEQLSTRNRKAEESISISYLPLWIVAISLCILAFVLVRRKDHIVSLVRSVFNNNLMRLRANEENNGMSLIYMCGYLLFIINLSLFLYMVAEKAFGIQMAYGYYMILLGLIVFFWGKHLVLAFFSGLFDFEKEALVYGFTINTLYNLLSLFFLSLNILLLFGPDTWIRPLALAGASLFIIFLLSRYYKGLYIGRKYLSDNFFHFFLYFCAFELSPWLIVYSLFRDLI